MLSRLTISKQELEALKAGHFELDCSEMTLTLDSAESQSSHSGPGYIRQTLDNGFEIKLYPTMPDSNQLVPRFNYTLGQIIPDTQYFALVATDIMGRTWRGRLPRVSSGTPGSREPITGSLHELKTVIESPLHFKSLKINLWFWGDYDLPLDLVEEITTRLDGEVHSNSQRVKATKFVSSGFEFLISKESDHILVEAVSQLPHIPEYAEERIAETLTLLLAAPIEYAVMQRLSSTQISITIRDIQAYYFRGVVEPPLSPKLATNAHSFWRLFDYYLRRIISHEKSTYPPLSRAIYSILLPARVAVPTHALVLSTAIEYILSNQYSELGEIPATLQSEIKQVRELIKSRLPNLIYEARILGTINAIRTSASDRLRSLVEKGAITNEQFDNWKLLRNASAHGDYGHFATLDELLALYYKVLVLCYHLIFYAIGYNGLYVDYGAPEWPTSEYSVDDNVVRT